MHRATGQRLIERKLEVTGYRLFFKCFEKYAKETRLSSAVLWYDSDL